MKGFASQTIDLKQSSLRIGVHHQKLEEIKKELEATRKHIREMEKYRDQHAKNDIKRHEYAVNINSITREFQHVGK